MSEGGYDDHDHAGYTVGYGKPPLAGRIKPGEVRNRYGRKGKPLPGDPRVQALAHPVTAKIEGQKVQLRADVAMWTVTARKALAGDDAAFAMISQERLSRPEPGPMPPTAEEYAEAAAAAEAGEVLSSQITAGMEIIENMQRSGTLQKINGRFQHVRRDPALKAVDASAR